MNAPYAQHAGSHAIERAWERYGVALTPRELAALEQRLAGGEGFVLRLQTDGSEQRLVREKGVAMIAVWIPTKQTIATFLPPGSRPSLERTRCGQTQLPPEVHLDSRYAKRRRARDGVRRKKR